MAKVGEGDSRWIVNSLTDGKNVNSWHWEERDLSKVTHQTLKDKFKGMELLASDDMTVKLKEVSDIEGDVTVAQRKSKIMCYFELKATIKWEGSVTGDSGKCEGKLTIPDCDHDNFEEEYDISVSASESNPACKKVEAWVRSNARQVIRSTIVDYFKVLYVEHRVGMNAKTGLPLNAKSPASPGPAASPASPAPAVSEKPKEAPKPKAPASSGSSTSFTWKMQWKCPIDDLFGALMREERASAYTRAPAKIDPRPSGTFEFLGGVISGYYVAVDVPNKITMQWRLSSWTTGVHSSVVIDLKKEEAGVTRMDFAQAGIPDGELQRVQQGWQVNFFDPMKIMFGYPMEYL